MPRTGRLVMPGYPHHIVQRGHNRQLVFAAPSDYEQYLCSLRELKEECGINDKKGQIYFPVSRSRQSLRQFTAPLAVEG